MQKICGAVERVDDPAIGFVVALPPAAFLAEKTVARPRLGELRVQNLFGVTVCRGDEIRRAFHRDLQVLDFAVVALETATGLAGCGRHHVKQCGTEHGGFFQLRIAEKARSDGIMRRSETSGRDALKYGSAPGAREGRRTGDVHAGCRSVKALSRSFTLGSQDFGCRTASHGRAAFSAAARTCGVCCAANWSR